jgi:hypothetical protein
MFRSNSHNDIFERNDGSYRYRGAEQLSGMNDASDVVDEMHFIIETLARQDHRYPARSGRISEMQARRPALARLYA